MTRISETVSENQPVRKPGRPKSHSDDAIQFHAGLWNETKSIRGLQNKVFLSRAIGLLMDDPEFAWVCNENRIRQVILVELGRIDDDETLHETARRICNLKPKAKEAAALIRKIRGSAKHRDPVHALADALCKCVGRYADRFGCSFEQARAAISRAAKTLNLAEKGATDDSLP